MTRQIRIFDTTLRDGEQAPGFSMTTERKLKVAHALAALKVDVMEAGFAAASPGDLDAIRAVASEIEGSTICSLARTTPGDIEAAKQALERAKRSRLHVFIGTSPIHRTAKLNMTTDEVLKAIEQAVGSAKGEFDEVEFSAEDAIRTERDFLIEALQCAAAAGADVLNVPDTVGYTSPEEIYELFSDLVKRVERPEHVIFSTHNHDDLGMAVANSLAAVRAGAGQVECTVNGIGERAGNCAMEEVVMALKTRADHYEADTGIETRAIFAASNILAECTGNAPPRNKAIVGRNAFAHEAGIHQHGVLNDRSTYEIMTPEDIGLPSNAIVLGKHSGKHALRSRLNALGHDMGDNRIHELFKEFKILADTKREVTDNDLMELVAGSGDVLTWRLIGAELRTGVGADANPRAIITVNHKDKGEMTTIGHGTGPFEALAEAFCAAAKVEGSLDSIDAHQLSREMDIEVGLTLEGERVYGRSSNTDIVVAAAQAFLNAFNTYERGKANAAREAAE